MFTWRRLVDQSYRAIHRHWFTLRTIVFWFFTLNLALELLAGSTWALLRIEFDKAQFEQLGYPLYLLFILGTWKLAGGVVILLPRLQRLKEWAYAGAFFDFSGGVASQLFAGLPNMWIPPAWYAAVTLISWALRADDRRLSSASSGGNLAITAWAVPLCIAALMLLISLFTLPKGISPSGSPAW